MTTETAPAERRRFHRILFDAPAELRLGGAAHQTRLIDVSLKGALVKTPAGWPDSGGREATLHIRLDPETASIRMQGTVAHREDDRIGFQCLHIDMDSITHLRRLVELNLADPDLLERELEALG